MYDPKFNKRAVPNNLVGRKISQNLINVQVKNHFHAIRRSNIEVNSMEKKIGTSIGLIVVISQVISAKIHSFHPKMKAF